MEQQVRHLMSRSLLTVSPETPLIDVTRMFVEDELHGVPVVGEDGSLQGFLSSTDLVRAVEEEHQAPSNDLSYFRDELEFSGPDWASGPADFQDRLAQLRVADAMQVSVLTVTEEATVPEVARLLREARIHRVIVVRGKTPVGLISSFDLLALLEQDT